MRKVLFLLLNLSVIIFMSVSGALAQTPGTYMVQRGDSLIRIARKTGTTVEALVEANKATYPCLATKPACLQTGWVLTLPGAALTPTSTLAPTTAPTLVQSEAYLDTRTALADEVNRLRTENGLATLSWDEAIAAFAQERSQDMAARNYFSHYDPLTGEPLAPKLASRRAYTRLCENIFGQWGRPIETMVAKAIEVWWNSPGHKACMLLPGVSVMGVGVAPDARGGWLVTLLNVLPK